MLCARSLTGRYVPAYTALMQSVTQHLGLLEDANLISVQRQGREKLHYFNPVPIHEIYERWIRKFEQESLEALHKLKAKLERKQP